jgi:plasmid maintenance system antidote protein VapI
MKFDVQLSEAKDDTLRAAICRSMAAQDRAIMEVAANAGIDRDTLRRYMTHKRDMTSERLGRLIKVLRIHVARRSDGGPLKFTSLRKIIGKRVETQEWSAAALAEQSKLDRSEVTRFLKGERDLSGRKVSAMLAPLGLMVVANITKPPIPRDWLQPLEQIQ